MRYNAIVEAGSAFDTTSAQQYVTNVTRSQHYTFHTRTLPTLDAAKQWQQEVLPITPEQ